MGAAFPDRDREGWMLVEARRDPEIFADLYELTEGRLVGYFFRRTACAITSADLTAETFAAALRGVRRFDPEKGSGMAWLFGIAAHLLSQWRRHERVEHAARARLGMRTEPPDDVAIERIEALVDFRSVVAELGEALLQLSPLLRDALVLRIVDELGYDEISLKLGCTPGTARVRVSRALDQLEQRLEATWEHH